MPNFNEGGETEMRQKDTESKALMKSYADVHRKVTKNSIELGNNVFIRHAEKDEQIQHPLFSSSSHSDRQETFNDHC